MRGLDKHITGNFGEDQYNYPPWKREDDMLDYQATTAIEDRRGYCHCSISIPANTACVCTACGKKRLT